MQHQAVLVRTRLGTRRGPARVEALRQAAYLALGRCAQLSGAHLGALEQDPRGAPRPQGGWFWSLTHSSDGPRGWVGAVLARAPVGIDLEPVQTRRRELVEHVLDGRERELVGTDAHGFASAWTAKEAVLKKLGVGLTELSLCRIVACSGSALTLEHAGKLHQVEQTDFDRALCSVSSDTADVQVHWTRDMGAENSPNIQECA